MYNIKQIAQGAMGGAAIAVATFLGNVLRIGYIIDPFLIPFCLMFFKYRDPNNKMILPVIVAGFLIFPYKFYLIIFIITYWILAEIVWKIGSRINLINIAKIALVYALFYYSSWAIISHIIYGYKLNQFIYLFTGMGREKLFLIWLVLLIEPIFFALALQLGLETIERYKV